MSHEVETMAYAGETPWHGLGEKIEAEMSVAEWRAAAGLEWDVYKTPDYIEIDGEWVPTGRETLLRDSDNRILTPCTDGWEPVLNKEIFEFFDHLRDEVDFETMGSLREGNIVWALAKLRGQAFELFGNDRVDSYLLFSNFHIYGRSTDVRFTPVRAVCNNTLSLALSKASKNFVKWTHAKKFDVEAVHDMLGTSKEKLAGYKEMAEFLSKRKATKEKIVEYFGELFKGKGLSKDKEHEDELRAKLSLQGRNAYDALETQPGAEYGEGTWWQPFNAVTYTVDHTRARTQDRRLESAWYGSGAQIKNRALELAVEYAEAA